MSVTAPAGAAVVATVPTWRRDIDVEADLAEEIARVHGYERVPPRLPPTEMPGWRETPLAARDAIREALVGAGLTEAVTYALVSPRRLESFAWSFEDRPAAGEATREGSADHRDQPAVAWITRCCASRSSAASSRRSTANARHGQADVAILRDRQGLRPGGRRLAGVVAPRPRAERGVRGAGLEPRRGARLTSTTRRAPSSWSRGCSARARRRTGRSPTSRSCIPGRSATVESRLANGDLAIAGVVGELHPRLAEAWDLRARRVVVAELSVAGLTAGSLPVVSSVPPPRFQPIERDLTVDVTDTVAGGRRGGQISVRGRAAPSSRQRRSSGTYRGHPLGPDERSLTFRLRFGARGPTLSPTPRSMRRSVRSAVRWRTTLEHESAPEPVTVCRRGTHPDLRPGHLPRPAGDVHRRLRAGGHPPPARDRRDHLLADPRRPAARAARAVPRQHSGPRSRPSTASWSGSARCSSPRP